MDNIAQKSVDVNDILKSTGEKGLIQQYEQQLPQITRPSTLNENEFYNIDDLHRFIVGKAQKVDFCDLIDKSGCDHNQYKRNGVLNIPQSIIAVLVNNYAIKLIDDSGLSIAQLHSNDADIKISYLFNGRHWLRISESFIKNLLRDTLVKMGYDRLQSKTARLSELLVKTFWSNVPKSPQIDHNRTLINLQNVLLELLPTGEVGQYKHSKDNFLLYCLPYDYNQNATCPMFTKYLDRVLPDKESQIVLQELLGSIFAKNIKLETIGVLYGSGANGKSVLLNILIGLLGTANISQMNLEALTTDSNAANNRTQLMGKLLNYAPEMNARGKQAHDLIKAMASCEALQGKLMYKDTFTFTDYARLVFNANTLPTDVEHSHGWWRRWLIIHFDQTISEAEKDTELANKIISNELPGILNWIIEGTKRIQRNKKFSKCTKSDEVLAEYKLDSDVVATWIAERAYVPHDTITKALSDLQQDLTNFINANGYTKLSSKTLAARLKGLGFKQRKGKPAKFYIATKSNEVYLQK